MKSPSTKQLSRSQLGPELAPRQREVLDLIANYWNTHQQSPTMRELQAMMGVKSINAVQCTVDVLVRKGYVWKSESHDRNIYINRGRLPSRLQVYLARTRQVLQEILEIVGKEYPEFPPQHSALWTRAQRLLEELQEEEIAHGKAPGLPTNSGPNPGPYPPYREGGE
jgi:SOS-response transcriptional repressor LexA